MRKLLHINAAPRGDESRTLRVSAAFLETFRSARPGCAVDELNLWEEKLPPLTVPVVRGKYALLGGKELEGPMRDAWAGVLRHIERFLSADAFLVSTPMWNFCVPYVLKHYLDVILQPRYLFRYTATGVEGLAKGRPMVVVSSRGGDYAPGSPMRSYDFLEPYLRTAFGFAGIEGIVFVAAQPMDAAGPEAAETALEKAKTLAREAARKL
ncbi:MAG: NAD(P)H-dependent oxidoreductase [Candidatus Aureabacteria bacterium]|nr:NAD(P)H-dependent oxidoreductase [Candidatus Auribacterota bacterium]NLW94922.1 ACP phosphodiesterase [Chlamydiota bacterium]HOE26555.1 NAD(P)H-dependent oxidoreductase [bacterium]HQM51679.1 NAD(P)H-dependent oxidoreductase [bacterium]